MSTALEQIERHKDPTDIATRIAAAPERRVFYVESKATEMDVRDLIERPGGSVERGSP